MDLYERRKRVLGRKFLRAARAYQERAVSRIHASGFEEYKLADNSVLVHLESKGNRMTELAQRSGLTKQAISQLVQDLESRDLVRREPDPSDGRAVLIRLTERGQQLLDAGVTVVESLDREIADEIGSERASELSSALQQILDLWDPDGF